MAFDRILLEAVKSAGVLSNEWVVFESRVLNEMFLEDDRRGSREGFQT